MKKKTILIIHKGYPLGIDAGDKIRTLNMAVSLLKLGYKVILLGYVTKNLHLIHKEKKKLPEGIRSLFIFTLPNRLGLAKIASLFRAVITYFVCKIYAVDGIQAELAPSATAARFVPNIPLVTDFHSDTVPELEMNGNSPSHLELAATENRFAIEKSLRTITVSERLQENLSIYSDHALRKNYILPCNFSETPFLQLDDNVRVRMRQENNLTERIVLCYSGGLHTWQCIRETLNFVHRLININPRYYFCLFTKDNIAPYKDEIDILGGNCMVKGLSFEEIPAYLSMIDVGLVLRKNSQVNLNSSPTKTSEYMAAGAMVITTQYAGDVPKLINDCQNGIVLDDLSIKDELLYSIDKKINEYWENYDENAGKVKSYVLKNRIWKSNEEHLKILYDEIYYVKQNN